jgi:two-component system sensor histidine kinase ChiS
MCDNRDFSSVVSNPTTEEELAAPQAISREPRRVAVAALLLVAIPLAIAIGSLAHPISAEPAATRSDAIEPHRATSEDNQPQSSQRPQGVLDKDIQFDRISIEQGLSQSVVLCILQDSKGFMWFGTQDGLNRYDGYAFKVYEHDPQDPDSLSNSFVLALYEDGLGVLWIGTNGGGLNRLDRESGRFVRYVNDADDPNSLSDNQVLSIVEDREGVLWIGTNGGGLNRFDRETGQFTRFQTDPDDPHSLSDNGIDSIYEDRARVLWIGTNAGGLEQFDRETGHFVHHPNDPNDPNSIASNNIETIYEDREGVLWIGTNAGLDTFDRETGRFVHYVNDPDDPATLSFNDIESIYQDREGTLWIATNGGGLDRFDRQNEQFVHCQNDPADVQSLSGNQVWSIYEDQAGVLWLGTFGAGLNRFDPHKDKFTRYEADPDDPNSLSNEVVWSIHEGQAGVLWVGTNGGGLTRIDRQTQQFVHYQNVPDDPNSLAGNAVWSIHQDQEGMLWVGTAGGLDRFDPETERFTHHPSAPVFSIHQDREGVLWTGTWTGGLGRLDPETEQFTFYQNDPADASSLSDNTVMSVREDREGLLWLATFAGGLNRFDRDTERFVRFQNDPNDPRSLSNDSVLSVHEDREGVLWIGTAGGGLSKFDRTTETFSHYRAKDGLPDDYVYGILEDDHGNLWLSTNRGLSKFDPRTGIFRNYDVGDGLQSNEFNQGSYYRSTSGEMFFGGVKGFNSFYPDDVEDNPYVPPIVITDFQLFNESVSVGDDSPLEKLIEETSEIRLSYQDDFLAFEFAALHYSAPDRNQYAYKMEGLDKDWNYVGTRRFASYTNMPAGEYTFRVKGSNSDGVWNEEGASIKLIISPPFWQTWWFRISIIGLVAGTVLGAATWRIRSIEAKRRELEILVDERTRELRETLVELQRAKEAAEAANQAKSVFLANMSHELRTPLNAILGFTQLMDRDTNLTAEQQENLGIINRSGEHLLGLINDVLDMSKIEAGRTTLNEQSFDLHRLLDGLEEMFRLRAEDRGLTLAFERSPDVPQLVRMDEGKLRQVLMNLLGNAVKFTPEGGVTLRVKALQPAPAIKVGLRLLFEVEDTGPGIAPEELKAVFDPFVQTTSGRHSQEGTGLGLAISRQFVRMMGGDLTVSSQVGRGSVFRFDAQIEAAEQGVVRAALPTRRVIGLQPGQPIYRLLIVDDKEVNRKLLLKLLSPLGFEVREAENGQQAIEMWESWAPHLIFMDMRMPVMDGYEATRRIKGSTKGQATVIVALTASALEEDRLVILSEGCDAYIRKPFREEDLFDTLTKHLGVRFTYREEPAELALAGPSNARDILTPSALSALPAEWLSELRQATIRADFNGILSSIDRIREQDARLADALALLARDFEYTKIMRLIEQAGG